MSNTIKFNFFQCDDFIGQKINRMILQNTKMRKNEISVRMSLIGDANRHCMGGWGQSMYV